MKETTKSYQLTRTIVNALNAFKTINMQTDIHSINDRTHSFAVSWEGKKYTVTVMENLANINTELNSNGDNQ